MSDLHALLVPCFLLNAPGLVKLLSFSLSFVLSLLLVPSQPLLLAFFYLLAPPMRGLSARLRERAQQRSKQTLAALLLFQRACTCRRRFPSRQGRRHRVICGWWGAMVDRPRDGSLVFEPWSLIRV